MRKLWTNIFDQYLPLGNLTITSISGLLILTGCSAATGIQKGKQINVTVPTAIEADPLAYLQRVAVRAESLREYRTTFYRQERLGLIPTLKKMERIDAAFRAEPFSVHFRWLDDGSEYVEASFVRGTHDDKVLLLPRHGPFGLPAAVGEFNVEDAVAFQKARNPITDFGLARLMQRTLKRIADAEPLGGAAVRYLGLHTAGTKERPAHRFEIAFPPRDPYPNKRMDLYIDPRDELPIGVYAWLPDGNLDALYFYEDLDASVALGSDAFVIRTARAPKSHAPILATEQ